MTDTASVKSMTGDQGVPKPVPPMGPYEALALYLYLKDNTEGWREPGKTMLLQAKPLFLLGCVRHGTGRKPHSAV